jgi:tetratricopeptide (TPR) repeat protein
VLAHPKVSPVLQGRAWALEGDLALRRHAVDEARADYERAAKLPLDEGTARLTTAKLVATRLPPGREADLLAGFLTQPAQGRDPAIDLLNLRELVALAPDNALYQYLFARQLEQRGKFAPAADALDRALAGTLPDETFTREALRLLGRARFRAGERDAARAAFERLARDPQAKLDAEDWLARVQFHSR